MDTSLVAERATLVKKSYSLTYLLNCLIEKLDVIVAIKL